MDSIQTKLNIVLIGMPGVGKSTLGALASRHLDRPFLDTDDLIQSASGKTLERIIADHGIDWFKQLEERVICGLDVTGAVIATGGSAVYSPSAVKHLQRHGCLAWLFVSYEHLMKRLGNPEARGVVRRPGQSLRELYMERNALYSRSSDLTVNCEEKTPQESLASLLFQLQGIASFEDLCRLRKARKG